MTQRFFTRIMCITFLVLGGGAFLPTTAFTDLGFGLPAALNSDAGSDGKRDGEPAIATDQQGNWVVIWSALTGPNLGGDDTAGGGDNLDSDLLVSRSADGGQT